MKGITRMLLIGFYLSRLSGTCVGQCFTKINEMLECLTEAFVVEEVTSKLYCAYKCHRDENCALFRHSETSKICQGCIMYGVTSTGPLDTSIYKRVQTGYPYDERDAACLKTCGVEHEPGCQDAEMLPLPLPFVKCFEMCKNHYNIRYYTYANETQPCSCGRNFLEPRTSVDSNCTRVCPKRGNTCEIRTVYKYRYGC